MKTNLRKSFWIPNRLWEINNSISGHFYFQLSWLKQTLEGIFLVEASNSTSDKVNPKCGSFMMYVGQVGEGGALSTERKEQNILGINLSFAFKINLISKLNYTNLTIINISKSNQTNASFCTSIFLNDSTHLQFVGSYF